MEPESRRPTVERGTGGAADPTALDPRVHYASREAALRAEGEALEARSRRLTFLRTVTFLGGFAAWVGADLAGVALPLGWGLVLAALVLFLALVRRHRVVRSALRRVEAARQWVREGVARLDRRWDLLPAPEPDRDLARHPFALDLDLFGPASLAALLGRVHTPLGRRTLHDALLAPADPEEIRGRQEAVRELSGAWEQRERAAVEGRLLEDHDGDPDAPGFKDFVEWCHGDDALPGWLTAAAWILPLVTLALLAGHLSGFLSARGWILILALQGWIALRWGRRLHTQFAGASTGVPGLRRVHTLLAAWEGFPARAPRLRREVDRLGVGDQSSSAALEKLERLLHLADLRLSSIYIVFAVGFLWDVHVVRGLLAWRRTHGPHVEGWLEALGELEALAALATLAGDHPGWGWPRVDPTRTQVVAEALGHPLLPPAACVRNDVTLGPPGTVLLVTGSNMSGKSTLLRSVGVAAVLAGAGGPVCARSLVLPPVRLFTSMRVQDSLEAGVSFFMAELLRLKALLDAAPPRPASVSPPGPLLLYLVDEILQGTNSEERQQAGRRLIRHLLRRWAVGAVTTHDLDLHRQPEVEEAAVLVHFREALDQEGEGLHFDYRLRDGLATTRNALRLAERVGLTDPEA